MKTELEHQPDQHRYALSVDGQVVAVAEYAINGDSISFTHTYTQPQFRNRGLGAEVVSYAMDDVEQHTTRRVVPMCWFVADWFETHPGRAALLTR
jgi:predicted GNAT family acetyltransferase